MRAALAAAAAARGHTSPNPWVGAAVARDGQVIATGATQPPGGPHAERVALTGLANLAEAELFVTLEPCTPFEGKRTPPCADLVIEAGIKKVFVALLDPDPHVTGRGVAALRAAGITVEVGDGAAEAGELLRPYIRHRQSGRPYVIAKFAASLDGRTATVTGDSRWITGTAARALAHEQRAWVDAILVGSGTVLADDPSLTARRGDDALPRQPLRVIVDGQGRIEPRARLFVEPGRTLVATTPRASSEWIDSIREAGAEIVVLEPAQEGGVNLDQLFSALGQRGVLSVWAEGGGTLLGSLFEGNHVDEVWAFVAPMIIGGDGLPAVGGTGALTIADAWRLHSVRIEHAGADVLVRGYVREFPSP